MHKFLQKRHHEILRKQTGLKIAIADKLIAARKVEMKCVWSMLNFRIKIKGETEV